MSSGFPPATPPSKRRKIAEDQAVGGIVNAVSNAIEQYRTEIETVMDPPQQGPEIIRTLASFLRRGLLQKATQRIGVMKNNDKDVLGSKIPSKCKRWGNLPPKRMKFIFQQLLVLDTDNVDEDEEWESVAAEDIEALTLW